MTVGRHEIYNWPFMWIGQGKPTMAGRFPGLFGQSKIDGLFFGWVCEETGI